MALVFFGLMSAISMQAQTYDNAAGLRLGFGFGGTFKHFLNESSALEAIVNIRGSGYLGYVSSRSIAISGLYEIHKPLDEVLEGLQWYVGGGALVGFSTSRVIGTRSSSASFGILGVIGLDYAFEDIPLNISVDWIPGIIFNGGGFTGDSGALAVRYIF